MADIKIICCDIDGTLLRDDKSLSEENRLWISKAVKEKDVKFVIVSGRILKSLKHFKETLGITGLSSCLNGTFLSDENDSVLANHTFAYEDALAVVQAHEETKVDLLGIYEDTWYTESKESYIHKCKVPMYLQEAVIVNLKELIKTTSINKFVFMSQNKADLGHVFDILSSQVPQGHLYLYPGPNFLEVMPGGISKATAVDDLIDYYKVNRNQVMAIGDDINDIEMIQKAGLGVAMGNALDCVKEIADAITDTNQNDGVAKAIQRYIFNI